MNPDPILALNSVQLSTFQSILILACIIILLLLSGLISGSEVAYFSLEQKDLEELESENNFRAKLVAELLKEPKKLLSTLLIVNNTINISIILLTSFLMMNYVHFEEQWQKLAFEAGLISSLLLLFGEIIPKVFASTNNKILSLFMSIPLFYIEKMPPISWLAVLLGRSTTLIEDRLSKKQEELNPEDFIQAIDLTLHKEDNLEDEKKIMHGLMKFGNISVKQIMSNRIDTVAVDSSISFEQLKAIVLKSGFSRIPVYSEHFDNIKGMLYSKDLIGQKNTDDFNWNELIRQAFFIPETKKISNLLKEFQSKKIHLAIVVDEYGGTSGIVTLEDILEEIVGEIRDEYDLDDISYRKISDNEFLMDAKTYLVDTLRVLNLPDDFFDDVSEEVDTLAGLVLEMQGTIPKFKSEMKFKNILFTVESVGKKSINRLRIKILDEIPQ